ncbi:MAG: tetratricopeptide repeat protein [Aggregatilineales bacterium]
MSIVTLRAYLDEVQDLISKEALEEAIGHCKYILQSFPKNVAVYRSLGQALLNKARYQEASDIFQRVLSAVPDDAMAHVAMSELYVEQDAIPQATWHLERAFEQDPNNQARKDKLRRMYEQRDGAAPDRVQLTRGALARLYYRGRLYEQATAELQAVLENESDRPDLLLLLAQTLWDNNHPVEAGETALRALEMLPDALEANALLARLWLQQKRPSDASPFIERVQALDPFRALELLAPDNPNTGDEITLPHLDWSARTNVAMLTDTPEWIQDVGSMFENSSVPERASDPFGLERRAGAVPTDWMTNFAAPGESAPPAPDWFAAPVPPPAQANAASLPEALDAMPDWFAEVAQTAQTPEAEAASALPSWLEDDEPAESPTEAPRVHSGYTDMLGQIATDRQQDEPVPSWADESHVVPEESPIPSWADDSSAVTDSEATKDMPDWFTTWDSAASPAPTEEPPQTLDVSAPEPAVSEGAPDWLSDLSVISSAPAAEQMPAEPEGAPGDIPDWMSSLALAEPAAELGVTAPEPTVSEGTPDWLSDLGAVSPASVEQPSTESEAVPGDLPDWMSSLAPAEPASDEIGTEPPIIDWLGADTSSQSEPFARDSAPADVPDWMSALTTPEPVTAAPEPAITEAPADSWLNDLAAVSPAPTSESMSAEPEAVPGDMPDWMSALAPAESPAEPDIIAEPEPARADLPDWMSALAPAESPAEPDVVAEPEPARADLPDWMSALAPAEPAAEPDVIAEPEPARADLPDWMSALAPAESPAEPATRDTTPSPSPEPELEEEWLRGFEAETSAEQPLASIPTPTSGATDAIPAAENDRDWLASVGSAPVDTGEDWLSRFGVVESPAVAQTPAQPTTDKPPAWLTDNISIQVDSPSPVEFLSAQAEPAPPATPEPIAEPRAAQSHGMTGLLNALSKSAAEPRPPDDTGILDQGTAPDWLTAFNDEPLPAETEPAATPNLPVEPAPVDQEAAPDTNYDSDVPSWLRNTADDETSAASSEAEPTATAEAPTPIPIAAKPAEDVFDPNRVPDFISALAPKDASAEMPQAESGTGFRFNRTPAWMRKLKK